MPYEVKLPEINTMLNDIPLEDQPEDEAAFWRAVAWELGQLMQYAAHAEQPRIELAPVRKTGTQYVWEFWVNDLSTPIKREYNWHGQNTSQWRYAGAIVLQNKRVSTHH